MTPLIGNLASLYLEEYGTSAGFGLIGCTTGDAIQLNTEMVEVTGATSAFVEVKPTYKSGSISSDTVLITTASGDTQIATDVIVEWHKNSQKLGFTFEWVDGATTYSITGAAYITGLSINAPAEDFISVSIQLQISGEWQLDF